MILDEYYTEAARLRQRIGSSWRAAEVHRGQRGTAAQVLVVTLVARGAQAAVTGRLRAAVTRRHPPYRRADR